MTPITGMRISGKISTGVRIADSGPMISRSSASTTNVYGRFRAIRTNSVMAQAFLGQAIYDERDAVRHYPKYRQMPNVGPLKSLHFRENVKISCRNMPASECQFSVNASDQVHRRKTGDRRNCLISGQEASRLPSRRPHAAQARRPQFRRRPENRECLNDRLRRLKFRHLQSPDGARPIAPDLQRYRPSPARWHVRLHRGHDGIAGLRPDPASNWKRSGWASL